MILQCPEPYIILCRIDGDGPDGDGPDGNGSDKFSFGADRDGPDGFQIDGFQIDEVKMYGKAFCRLFWGCSVTIFRGFKSWC